MSFRIFTQFKRLLKQAFIPNVSCLNLHLLSLFFSSPIASHFFHIVNPRWYHSCDLFYAMNQEHDSRDRDQKSGAWGSQAVKLKSRRGCQSILTNKLNRVMISFGNAGHFKSIWKGRCKNFHSISWNTLWTQPREVGGECLDGVDIWPGFLAFGDALKNCIYWQWFSKVIPGPCSDILHRIILVFNAVLPEGSKGLSIQSWFSTWHLMCWDFSRSSKSLGDIIEL